MSFYVTLPSNSSMDLYPNNTISQFTVALKEPIRLNSNYEIALVEMTYKHSWSLQVGKLYIDLVEPNFMDTFDLVYHDGENIKNFAFRLNGEITQYYIEKEYNRRYKLKEDNNFPLFENVLNVNCALNTTCIFGLNDYVSNIMKIIFIYLFLLIIN